MKPANVANRSLLPLPTKKIKWSRPSTANLRPTFWRPQSNILRCQPDDPRYDEWPADLPRCVTPTLTDVDTMVTVPPAKSRHIDRKMQMEWRQDMLDEDRRTALQDRTDQFLGKALPSIAAIRLCDSAAGGHTSLPPKVHGPVRKPDAEDPFLSNCRSRQSPASGAVEDELDTTSIRSMSADMHTMVTSGMTSHDDSVAPAQRSGDEQRLIIDMAAAIPTRSSGPGGFTGVALAEQIRSTLSWTAPTTSVPEFSFRWSQLSAKKNLEILRGYNMDLASALAAQPFSTLTIGSEFRPTCVLEPLLQYHPLWHRMKTWINDGITYPLYDIPEEERQEDLQAMLVRGNHKSAIVNAERLQNMLEAEVIRGWQLILPREAATMIPQAVIGPVGLVEQDSINEFGEIVPKW